jgi:hypothetical protein
VTASRTARLPGAKQLRTGHVVCWWVEVVGVLAFYLVYSWIRNANEGDYVDALANARDLIEWQRALGIFNEQTVQNLALDAKPFIIAANYFYGSLHFIVTIGAAVFLYRWFANDYPRFRNTLAVTTALALVGFVLFPLAPPRLLPAGYGFVDTLAEYPTFWSFNSGAVSKVSNQYAAMPSVHCAWALWCAFVFVPRVRMPALKVLAALYPVLTVLVIVITGNHYWLDAVGGFLVLGVGYVIAHQFTRAGRADATTDARESGTERSLVES